MAEDVMDAGVSGVVAGVNEPPQKTFSQAELEDIVRTAKDKTAYASYKKGLEEGKSQVGSTMGGMPQLTKDQIEDLVNSRLAKAIPETIHQLHANQIANNFKAKMEASKDKYPDLQDRLSKYDLQKVGNIFAAATQHDNTADILDDLDKNPQKLLDLIGRESIAPGSSLEHLGKLSASIRNNQDAAKRPKHAEPLSQINASPVGAGDGSADDSLEAYKNADWLQR